jgi:hypothetical protein
VLHADGFEPTDDATLADLIVVNTCSVREKAEHKLMSLLGTLRPLKEQRPGVVLAVAGCVAQQEGERCWRSALHRPGAGARQHPRAARAAREAEGGAPPRARTVFDMDEPQFLHAEAARGPARGDLVRDRHEGLRRALHLLHRALHPRQRALPRLGGHHRREIARSWRAACARSRSSGRP